MVYKYKLCRKNGIWQTKIYNSLIGGASIEGKVLAVEGEKVKLHLKIDDDQSEEEAAWFPYAPPTGNVMYSMPIVGTEARLYFPSENGENPRITGCVRTNGSSCAKTSDTTKRYFGTEHGSELEMTPGALNIKGGSKEPLNISIDDEIGVTITSPKKLTLAADDEIIMKTPKSVKLKAESQILVAKENSQSGFSLENEMHFKSNNVIKDGSCRDTYEAFKDEPEAGQKPPPEEEKSGFNWGGLLMAAAAAVAVVAAVATFGIGAAIVGAVAAACIGAICSSSAAATAAGIQSAMGALAISSCAAVCGAVLWDFSEQDDTNNYSWEDADKYINSRLLGICIGNKIYYNHEISNLPREITYKKNGYTYTYMLDEHKQYFMGLEMPSGPDITLKDGRVISDKKYEYKLVYTDEPKLSIGIIQVSPGKTSVAGNAKGRSGKGYNVKEGTGKGKTPGPTIDGNTGKEVGRFIGDEKGNIMIEPKRGSTVPAGKGGVDTHTTYPNGSNYKRYNPNGHPPKSTSPHGHGHLEGTGPGIKGQGPSIDVNGNVVPWNSADAHWPIK